ncbi:MAG: transketolase C-terminal domain-containing protein [Cytophagales bacterium]|nr:transketolase C-terminal domain-containing protein [Cytophagales bacterium]
MIDSKTTSKSTKITLSKDEILNDYALAVESRQASLIGRKEVFMGKAKFGIFGDGKELPQLAMARFFRNGDFRSGYYRDQTFMMAIGQLTVQQFFAQLYAHTDVKEEPASAGRLMNGHFATRSLNNKGEWKTLTDMKNSSADISCTAGQMPRLLGLAYASKLYRENPDLQEYKDFSINGNEIAYGTIGNASTSEGHFLETLNAAGVLQVPMVISVWDDGYGISVPQKYHTIKESISAALAGYQKEEGTNGFEILVARGWNYQELLNAYAQAEEIARKSHVPCLVHITELTQPQGHSTSGSHERYKSKDRLAWEEEYDCLIQMKKWILDEQVVDADTLAQIEKDAKQKAKKEKDAAWKAFRADLQQELEEATQLLQAAIDAAAEPAKLNEIANSLKETLNPIKSDVLRAVRKSLRYLKDEETEAKRALQAWLQETRKTRFDEYSSHMYSESPEAAIKIGEVRPEYKEDSRMVDGREVLQACFDHHLSTNPLVFAIGEDVGKIGDVNQGFAGLQDKHGELKVTDTGIRETSIIGQGIGAALRGLRPITEIQYLDYLLYAIQTLSDDLATLQYRTKGGQKAPMIIRTRGHRLEGVWHSGSPMSMILGALRGVYVLVPRNMTQAAGFYNTMLESDDTAIIIESLNGYRLKERIPENLQDVRTPLGVPEILHTGEDLTIVTYGSTCRIVMEAASQLREFGISAEVIDVQSLLPFDRTGTIASSVRKTNRVLFVDEDVPGGATAFMMQQVLDRDGAYQYLDSKPRALSGMNHRPAYSSDGDYFSKPNAEDIFEEAYAMMAEVAPEKYSDLY